LSEKIKAKWAARKWDRGRKARKWTSHAFMYL
jgi:hypothetical protein